MNDAALDRLERWLSVSGLEIEELDALRELRAECGRLRGQRNDVTAFAVGALMSLDHPETGMFEAAVQVREELAKLSDPAEAARLAAIVFEGPEGE